jgi:hypothetical protein
MQYGNKRDDMNEIPDPQVSLHKPSIIPSIIGEFMTKI